MLTMQTYVTILTCDLGFVQPVIKCLVVVISVY